MTTPASGSPTASVVMPFLDPPLRFMEEAVASVLGQTFPDWELILVDDGSTGPATSLAQEYARTHPDRVGYAQFEGHQHRGLSAARNLGLRHARGAFLSMLDADDVWVPEKLEHQVEILRQVPRAGMVYGTTRYWYSWTGRPEDARRDYIQQHALRRRLSRTLDQLIEPPALLTSFLRGELAVPSVSNVMFRKTVAERLGGFEEAFLLYEDQTLYAKVGLAAPVFVSTECWDHYRQHPESLSATAEGTERPGRARRQYLEWLSEYAGRGNLGDDAFWQALRRQQWLSRHQRIGRLAWGVWRRLGMLGA